MLSPVILFVYKRLDCLKLTIAALQENTLAKDTQLFIFSDAAKTIEDKLLVDNVRNYVANIEGFKSVQIYYAEKNKGLASSIIEGVTQIINQYGKAIVLEDDLVTSKNFLVFMNKALDYYKNNPKVLTIAGYTPLIQNPGGDIYFTQRASSWGWATWKNRWQNIDWQVKSYKHWIKNPSFRQQFNRMGSDMYKMLNDQMSGKINSWAIRLCYHQFLVRQFTVFPAISKVINIGMGDDSTHTKNVAGRFKTTFDESNKYDFNFSDDIKLDRFYLKQFLKPYSIRQRAKYKLLNLLKK